MKHLLALLVLALTLISCAGVQWSRPIDVPPEDAGHVFVCIDLPKERWDAADEAVRQWDYAIHQWKHVEAVNGGVPYRDTCSLWVHETTEPLDDEATNHHALAWASMLGGFEISMMKGRYEHDVTGILMHEMGHAFGAQHVAGTLMNPQWYPHGFICPDATTVAQVAAWNQVNLDTLRYCIP